MKRIVSIILMTVLMLTAALSAGGFSVSAEATTYDFFDLLSENKVKVLGRTKSDMVTAYWTGNAIELNINNKGGDVVLTVNTTEPEIYFEGFIDGVSVGRSDKPATEGETKITFTNIPEGEHLLRIVRESSTSKDSAAFTFLDSITFNGTVGERPADRELFVEIIGDSVAVGAGALGTFGEEHKNEYHSGTHSFGYYIAEELNADYSIVAAGGIGLYILSHEKKEWYTGEPTNIQKMYEYTNGIPDFGLDENKYDFPRKPDIIIIRIGANDDTNNETEWRQEFVTFVKRLHEINGKDVPIVFSGKAGTPHYISVQNAKSTDLKDANLYLVSTAVGGSGTAALKTQATGHPNAKEQKELADSILAVIRKNGLDKPVDRSAEEGEEKAQKESSDDNFGYYVPIFVAVGAALGAIYGAVIAVKAKKNKKAASPASDKEEEEKTEE